MNISFCCVDYRYIMSWSNSSFFIHGDHLILSEKFQMFVCIKRKKIFVWLAVVMYFFEEIILGWLNIQLYQYMSVSPPLGIFVSIYNALCFIKEKNLNLFITLQSPFHLSLKKLSAWDTRNIEKLDFPLNQAYSKLKNLTDENWYTEKEQKDSWPVFPSLQILYLFLLTSVLLKSVLF